LKGYIGGKMPLFGPPNIEKLMSKRNTKGLIKALQDAKLRRDAVVALGKIRDPRAVPSLIDTLQDPDPKVQQAAAVALGEISDTAAAQPLVDALKNRNLYVRQAAAEALGKVFKGKDFWPEDFPVYPLVALMAALMDMPRVHEAAFKALVEIGTPAVPALVALLKHKDPQLRCYAINVLGEIRDARTVELIVSSLYESDRGVRICAAEALGRIGDGRAVEGLIDTLKYGDKDGSVHRSAAQALKRLGWQPELNQVGAIYWITHRQWDQCVKIGKSAVRPLIALLKHDDSSIRKSAAEALGKIGDARAVEPLLTILNDRDKAVQDAAIKALGEIGDSRALEPLLNALIGSYAR
jgi:HEAT repeat protein